MIAKIKYQDPERWCASCEGAFQWSISGVLGVWFVFSIFFGGGGEIRTLGRLSPTPVFKTGALNHYATPPKYITILDYSTIFLGNRKGQVLTWPNLHMSFFPFGNSITVSASRRTITNKFISCRAGRLRCFRDYYIVWVIRLNWIDLNLGGVARSLGVETGCDFRGIGFVPCDLTLNADH